MQKQNEYFNEVLNLCEKNFSHEELIRFLKNGNLIERQHAALNLQCVKSNEEANILMSNLVGIDGKIREAAALKISELTEKSPELFFDKINYNIFSNATIDIDGNVCRLAISAAYNLIKNKDFALFYTQSMINIIFEALEEISKFTFKDKKYKINKQIFKIYWCLEALIIFYNFADRNELKTVIKKCSELQEYTVREKCAKILNKIPLDNDLETIKIKLKTDENYYVRNILNN